MVIAFLDASALIYLLDGDAGWAEAVKRELRTLAGEHGQLTIALSRLSALETRVGPLRRRDDAALARLEAFFARLDVQWVELTAAVVDLATTLRAHHGLRTPDALQAACCLQLGPDAVMLTGDADFGRLDQLKIRVIQLALR